MNTIDENKHNTAPDLSKPTRGLSWDRKITLALVVAMVVLALGMYFWKTQSEMVLNAKVTQVESDQAQARAQLIDQAKQLDTRSKEESLRRFSMPLAWAIRRELMANNLEQVDQYFTDLVGITGIDSALLATPDGKIMVATDRKQLTLPFSSLYPIQYLQSSDIKIKRAVNGHLLAIIPIMGLNQNMGTLVLEATPPVYPLR